MGGTGEARKDSYPWERGKAKRIQSRRKMVTQSQLGLRAKGAEAQPVGRPSDPGGGQAR